MLALSASQNLRRPQRIDVGGSCPRNRYAVVGENPVPARNFPRANSVNFQRNLLPITPPPRAPNPPVRLAPLHIFRPVDRRNFLRQILLENLGRRAAFPRDFGGHV